MKVGGRFVGLCAKGTVFDDYLHTYFLTLCKIGSPSYGKGKTLPSYNPPSILDAGGKMA